MRKKDVIGIVDAYSTGKYLAPLFKKKGYSCIHIQSSRTIPNIFSNSFFRKNFKKNIIANQNLETTIKTLKSYQFKCIIPGTETGVFIADYLSEKLGLPTNGIEKSKARFNKFEMIEVLKKNKIKTAKFIKSNSSDEIIAWSEKENISPVVMKPLQSAGNDHVIFCDNRNEIATAFNEIISNTNLFGKKIM